MHCLGYVGGVEVVVIRVAMPAITLLNVGQKRLQRRGRNLKPIQHSAFLLTIKLSLEFKPFVVSKRLANSHVLKSDVISQFLSLYPALRRNLMTSSPGWHYLKTLIAFYL